MKTVIAGGSGFIGHALVREFSMRNHDIVVLSRSNRPAKGAKVVVWDAKTVGPWAEELEGADTLINLAGKEILGRWTQESKRQFLTSRVDSTATLARAVEQCQVPPLSWLNASAVGYYGEQGEKVLDENSPSGSNYLAALCREWEAAQESCRASTAKARMRIGFVLGRGGGAFPILRKLTQAFLGSALGSGRQWVPWIHLEDLARAFVFCAENRVEGPVNAVGPNPARNAQLMEALRSVLHRPWAPNVPKALLRAASYVALPPPEETTLISQRVIPARLNELAFEFRHPMLERALQALAAES